MAESLPSEQALYLASKQAFHSGNDGSTLFRVHSVTAVGVASFALWSSLPLRSRTAAPSGHTFVVELVILAVPLVLSVTVLSEAQRPFWLASGLFAMLLARTVWHRGRRREAGPTIVFPRSPVISPRSSADTDRGFSSGVRRPSIAPILLPSGAEKGPAPLPSPTHIVLSPKLYPPDARASGSRSIESIVLNKSFVTVYRAQAMLMTCICILAVDFPAFPREHGKTETYGTSLMDLGVGSFVFSLGLVSALPLLRPLVASSLATAQRPSLRLSRRLRTAAKRSVGIFALGLVRLAMVKGTAYPEQVAEYGVHWNFFFTLSLLPIVGTLAEQLWPTLSYLAMAMIVVTLHQTALSSGLQRWVIEADRVGLVSMNKEGLSSLPGYAAIFMLGVDAGLFVLPPDPYFVERAGSSKQAKLEPKPGKLATILAGWSIIWWSAYFVISRSGFLVSRRTANALYVVWIAAFNTTVLLAYLLVELAFNDHAMQTATAPLPTTYEAVNRNSLAVFLVANLLTGAVNLSLRTIYAPLTTTFVTMMLYTTVLIAISWRARSLRLRI